MTRRGVASSLGRAAALSPDPSAIRSAFLCLGVTKIRHLAPEFWGGDEEPAASWLYATRGHTHVHARLRNVVNDDGSRSNHDVIGYFDALNDGSANADPAPPSEGHAAG